jgi:acetyltransferase-like isoleucine patch superfamily enzyme
MRRDHRPLWLKRTFGAYRRWWCEHFLVPQLDAVGEGLVVYNPQHVEVDGAGVRFGRHVHMMATYDAPIRFHAFMGSEGISVGDYAIITPGVRIASAVSIEIGHSCMFANHAYVTDADWHGVYDRTAAPGAARPVKLEDNVWIGDSAIVCKGVHIGENSVIGAGAVVASDIPANSIAVGSPARVIKELDPARELVRRERLFEGEVSWAEYIEGFDRWVLTPNTLRRWLRSKLAPTREL